MAAVYFCRAVEFPLARKDLCQQLALPRALGSGARRLRLYSIDTLVVWTWKYTSFESSEKIARAIDINVSSFHGVVVLLAGQPNSATTALLLSLLKIRGEEEESKLERELKI